MRLILTSFVAFMISALFLLPQLLPTFELPEAFYLYGPLSLMAIAVFCQVEGTLMVKKVLQANKHANAFDALEADHKELTERLHLEKKKVTDLKAQVSKFEKSLRDAQKDWQNSLAGVQAKEKQLLGERAQLQTALNTAEKLLAEKSQLAAKAQAEVGHNSGQEKLLQFLGLLQEKGRFLDFVMEEVASYQDAQVGAAARVVHAGCRQVMQDYFALAPVLGQDEGSQVVLDDNASARPYRLVGAVSEPPYVGTLLHRGWRTSKVDLPVLVPEKAQEMDVHMVIAPAQVEVHSASL